MNTLEGGKLVAATNKRLYGEDYYSRIGAIGGKKGKKDGAIKGFARMSPDKLREASAKGGAASRKSK